MAEYLYRIYKKHDGKTVKINGLAYKIKCREYPAKYPRPHTSYNVDLVPVNQNSEHYRAVKKKLGDDWTTDGLQVSDATLTQIFKQLGVK